MSLPKGVPAKIRPDDLKVARAIAQEFPVSQIDVITAWRKHWERASESDQIRALKEVRQPAPLT